MKIQDTEQLVTGTCKPCEGGVDPYSTDQAAIQIEKLSGWNLTHEARRIRKTWSLGNFLNCVQFLNKVAEIAEAEQHHPDIHLEGYRNITIELTTHAIGGLSENDFILAAKIDRISP